MPKKFVQEPFRVSIISGTEKVYEDKLGGGIKIFRRRFFCLTVSKKSVGGNPLVFPYFRVSKTFG